MSCCRKSPTHNLCALVQLWRKLTAPRGREWRFAAAQIDCRWSAAGEAKPLVAVTETAPEVGVALAVAVRPGAAQPGAVHPGEIIRTLDNLTGGLGETLISIDYCGKPAPKNQKSPPREPRMRR